MDLSDEKNFDIIVIGGGIAGMQASLDLADQGYRVAIVEKDATIGGKMIRLDKVFPTLDCASCITTPKMASVAHHKNIYLFTMCELKTINREGDTFSAKIIQKPRYVVQEDCIGCRQCEYGCPIMVSDENQRGLTARKAIYIPFSNAIPQIARLDMDNCTLCGKCRKICPTQAVDYFQEPQILTFESKAVLFTTGYQLLENFPQKAYGKAADLSNLINALEIERILAPTGPYGHMLRPSDGKEPESIAFINCAGSRDEAMGVGYCSRVCCMYSIKNAILIKQESPATEVSIFYMDIRAFGKNYEQFYRNAQSKGIKFIKGKARVSGEGRDQGVILRYEDIGGTGAILTKEFDMVILSLAIIPAWNPEGIINIPVANDGFLDSPLPKLAPSLTDEEGVFIAGISSGPKDIVDTIMEAGSAAMEAANYLESIVRNKTLAA